MNRAVLQQNFIYSNRQQVRFGPPWIRNIWPLQGRKAASFLLGLRSSASQFIDRK